MAIGRQLLSGLCLGLTICGASLAQTTVSSPKIIISNANTQIPLDSATPVQYDSAGDMTVACRLVNGSCPGLDGGGQTGAPTVTLNPSTATTITTAQTLSLSWTSTNADTCYSYDPTGITGWTGVVRATSGSQNLNLAQGTYVFKLRCYNTAGFTSDDSATITVNQVETPPPAADYCQEYYGTNMPTAPSFTAHGFTRVSQTIPGMWGVDAGDETPTKHNLPGDFMSSTRNAYLAIEFSLTDTSGGHLSQMAIDWIDGGSIDPLRSGGSIWYSVSPCPGDFRAPVSGSSDQFLQPICRASSTSTNGRRFVTVTPALTGCLIPANKKMYINIATYRFMSGSTTPTDADYTCPSGSSRCGVGALLN